MTWDTSVPAGTAQANTLDTIIQQFKTDIQTALRGNAAEGAEAVFPGSDSANPVYRYRGLIGTTAARPAAADGGLYFNTTTGTLQRSNGTSWVDVGPMGGAYGQSASPCTSYTNSTTSLTDITNLSVPLTVNGNRPVEVGLASSNVGGNAGYVEIYGSDDDAMNSCAGNIVFLEDATQIANQQISTGWYNNSATLADSLTKRDPVSAYRHIYMPSAAGTYTYKAQGKVSGTPATLTVKYCYLWAREI